MTPAARGDAWAALRYGPLLAWAGSGERAARAYAALVAAVEVTRDGDRRRVATRRIRRWLGTSPAASHRVFLRCLASEAREEADFSRLIRRPDLRERFRTTGEPRHGGPTLYLAFHLGSPIACYLHLRVVRGLDVRVVGRKLEDTRPLPEAKRAFAQRKVRWIDSLTGTPFLAVDARGLVLAREELLAGRSLYVSIDVPGDSVDRADDMTICGERLLFSSGVLRLAALTGVPIQPVVAVRERDGFAVHYGPRFEGADAARLLRRAEEELERTVRAFATEWWMWPYVVPSRPAAGARSPERVSAPASGQAAASTTAPARASRK